MRRLRAAGAVAIVTCVLASCSAARTTSSPPPSIPPVSRIGASATGYTGSGPKVVILGDSLTVMGWHDLYRRLDRDHAVAIVAWWGEGYNPGRFSIALQAPPLVADVGTKTFAPTRPDVAVLALGTNDAWERRPTARALATMRAMVGRIRARMPGRCHPA
jgi:lysophospholipase L1-like esterase